MLCEGILLGRFLGINRPGEEKEAGMRKRKVGLPYRLYKEHSQYGGVTQAVMALQDCSELLQGGEGLHISLYQSLEDLGQGPRAIALREDYL